MALSPNVVGAHVLVFINGFLLGKATAVRWNSQTPLIERHGIDALVPFELSNGPVKIAGQVSVLRLHGDGGLEGRGIVAPFTHLSKERYFSILLIDRVTGKRLHQADFCRVSDQSWNYAARNRVEGTFSFQGLEWRNEAEYA